MINNAGQMFVGLAEAFSAEELTAALLEAVGLTSFATLNVKEAWTAER
ncbi:MAG: hypothetical protein H0W08_19155 [Acidobacteria bacterium]|nr:hypothetical protein [Acidobacteriota bacterium]